MAAFVSNTYQKGAPQRGIAEGQLHSVTGRVEIKQGTTVAVGDRLLGPILAGGSVPVRILLNYSGVLGAGTPALSVGISRVYKAGATSGTITSTSVESDADDMFADDLAANASDEVIELGALNPLAGDAAITLVCSTAPSGAAAADRTVDITVQYLSETRGPSETQFGTIRAFGDSDQS